jgi:hypothetical protein
MWTLFLFKPIKNYELKIGVAKRKFDAVNYGRLDISGSGWLSYGRNRGISVSGWQSYGRNRGISVSGWLSYGRNRGIVQK